MSSAIVLMTLLALSGVPTAAGSEAGPAARSASEMTGAEIDVHNQDLAATDANYIRCRRIEVSGSLVKKLRVCNTNANWKRIGDKGNQEARDSMELLARGWTNSREIQDDLGPEIRPQ